MFRLKKVRYYRVSAVLAFNDQSVYIDLPVNDDEGGYPNRSDIIDRIYSEFNPKGLMNKNLIGILTIAELSKKDYNDFFGIN